MQNSKALAKVIGPTLSVMAATEWINLHIWSDPVPQLTYLNGVILFAAGIYIVRIHNQWAFNWTILITLTGWIGMAVGLFRMVLPEAKQAEGGITTLFMLSVLALAGIIMAYKGYYNRTEPD
ncbi:hypothetical protein [Chryseosolibacter indicus]|uniref:SPW repeat-containing protein n=1 Tax=Chryseosolibacter indicus TaxID=2782351 RepID=A0ABS5VWB8_9BACT|nr:hypothetical protein [Chryseosolibacter indicus]MBT1705125.1 hypothetical protein [Chryseosolibacter indicus]